MSLPKASLLNSVSVIVKVLAAFILNKFLAVYVGPSGYALVGQFQSFVTALNTVIGISIGTGVTKLTAENDESNYSKMIIFRTAVFLVAISSIIIGALVIFCANDISFFLLKSRDFSYAIVCASIFLSFSSFNAIILGIINGLKQFKLYVALNVAGTIVGFVFASILIAVYGMAGALIGISMMASIPLMITVMVCRKLYWFKIQILLGMPSKKVTKQLLNFSLVIGISLAFTLLAQIYIRNHIIDGYSLEDAGYWEGVMRISGVYLTVVTAPMAAYLLPVFAEIRTKDIALVSLVRSIVFTAAVTSLFAFFIYSTREILVPLLFSGEFFQMADLIKWQLIGDIVKSVSMVISYFMLAKGVLLYYLINEVLFSIVWVYASIQLIDLFGLGGAQLGYLGAYGFLAITQCVLLYRWYISK